MSKLKQLLKEHWTSPSIDGMQVDEDSSNCCPPSAPNDQQFRHLPPPEPSYVPQLQVMPPRPGATKPQLFMPIRSPPLLPATQSAMALEVYI